MLNKPLKIVFLDVKTIGEDIDYSGFEQLGNVEMYGFSTPEEARVRTKDADVVVLNKVVINEENIYLYPTAVSIYCVSLKGFESIEEKNEVLEILKPFIKKVERK